MRQGLLSSEKISIKKDFFVNTPNLAVVHEIIGVELNDTIKN